jgi:signal transduction histidine kinase
MSPLLSRLLSSCAALFTAAAFAATPPSSRTPGEPPARSRAPVTTVAEAFRLWPDLAGDDQPVHLEGIVIGTMPNGAFRLHDGELGLYATKSAAGRQLQPGDRVAVSGLLRRGGFSPWITPSEIVPLGRGAFPEARPASYSVLASGSADNQWLEIEGIVRSVDVPEPGDFVVLNLGMSGGSLRVLVNHDAESNFSSLVDATVRLRGVGAVNVNKHGDVVEPSFRVPSFAEITILEPAQPDPFAQPSIPLEQLRRFSPGVWLRHRVRTSGVVTRQLSENTVFVRDGARGLKIETSTVVSFAPGDVIDIAGFPAMEEGMAVLEQAVCRRMHHVAAPAAVTPSMPDLLEGTHNSDLVSIRARLVDWVIAGRNVTLVFQSGNQLFKGLFVAPAAKPSLPARDSLVNVSGICVISELEDIWFYQPRSFLLLVANLGDLQVLQAPPWWTPGRLWRALAITGFVLLTAVVWVWSLRRQIEQTRAVIEQQARHAAALEERSRIARELHDTLEQGLTGLSLQMKAMETDLSQRPQAASSRLQFARQILRQSRALARNAIRELRSEATPVREGLLEGLERVARSWNHSGASRVEIVVHGNARPLPARFEQHLLGIGTEAMTNAVKHGRAGAISVEVDFRAAEVAVRIKDNGSGFDPDQHLERASGCFGLIGMRERVREICGEIRILSQPGHGAEILVTAPCGGARLAAS